MAEDFDTTRVLGFEEGRLWLPSHIFNETSDSKEYSWPQQKHRRFPVSLIDDQVSRSQQSFPKPGWKSSRQRSKHPTNRASGGPGMQAVFLSSGERSCGTGVFLPRRVGDDFQPNTKPGCSTVLLPSRVVHALNLNVHALGSQLKPQRELVDNLKCANRNPINNHDNNSIDNHDDEVLKNNVSPQRCVLSKSHGSSPDIFLPKEWSY
ncbi:hypothetical protein AAC387_Pa03g2330 [Persea americana]